MLAQGKLKLPMASFFFWLRLTKCSDTVCEVNKIVNRNANYRFCYNKIICKLLCALSVPEKRSIKVVVKTVSILICGVQYLSHHRLKH